MLSCSTCNGSYDSSALFCPNCGASARRSSTNRSYSGSLFLGIGLVALVIVWNVISTLTPPQSPSDIKAAIPEPPDDAAILIAKCGAPDTDKSSGTAVQIETRLLVNQKAR